jgi:oligopeptide/dipeptide ABC transporter ATP-binding protein
MIRLKEELAMSVLLITHDLGVVAQMASRVVVMYAGQVVEEANVADIFDYPFHPYTQGLLKSMPRIGDRPEDGKQRLIEIPGIVPVLTELIDGCKFAERCPHAFDICRRIQPQLVAIADGHQARCWLKQYPERRKSDV